MDFGHSKKLLRQAAGEAAHTIALGARTAAAGAKAAALGAGAAVDGLQELVAPTTLSAAGKLQSTAHRLSQQAEGGLQATGGAIARCASALLAKKPTMTARHYAIAGAAAAGVAVALGAAYIIWHRVISPTYLDFRTKFGRARIYQVQDDLGRPVRLLEVGGVVQSGTYLDDDDYADLVFEYLKLYDLMFEAKRPIKRICVLGCGGYDYPEHLIAHHPGTIIDAVEVDPAITSIAERYFFLDRLIEEYGTEKSKRLNLICDDALDHLLHAAGTYDAIVNDTFDAGKPPAHLATADFVAAVHDKLSPGGIYLTNIVSPLKGKGSEFLLQQIEMLRERFAFVYAFPCAEDDLSDPDNIIVAATDDPLPEQLAQRALQPI